MLWAEERTKGATIVTAFEMVEGPARSEKDSKGMTPVYDEPMKKGRKRAQDR